MTYTAKIGDTSIPLQSNSTDQEVIATGVNTFQLIQDGTCHKAQLINHDGKQVLIKVNGHKYQVHIHDDIDNMVASMGLDKVVAAKASSLKAPMPGLILEILVKEGDEVTNGTQLLVLEAMKMENMITSEGDGIVQKVEVSKGDIVEKNQLLIELQ